MNTHNFSSIRLIGTGGGADIPIGRSVVVVGRHPRCDVRIESPRVSRHHCCLTECNGGVLVRDLGSTNGVRINGRRVRSGRLGPGDELSIAHLHFRVAGDPAEHREGRPSERSLPGVTPSGARATRILLDNGGQAGHNPPGAQG